MYDSSANSCISDHPPKGDFCGGLSAVGVDDFFYSACAYYSACFLTLFGRGKGAGVLFCVDDVTAHSLSSSVPGVQGMSVIR